MTARRSAFFSSHSLRRLGAVVLAVATLACLATAAPAQVVCDGPVLGKGRSSAATGATSSIPVGLARTRSVDDWQAKVGLNCPGRSNSWLRAKAKSIECDGTAGATICVARARPARKLF
jgi:hypothetical protein